MVETFRRYTDVLSLMDIIHHERLTLLSPSRWYDQNDSFGLDLYSKRLGGVSVYALCLAGASETAHHWQIFSGHSHGLCIHIYRENFIEHIDNLRAKIIHGPVQYKNLKQLKDMRPIEDTDLPFLKRDTFKAENEYRLVAHSPQFVAGETFSIPFPLELIQRVTFGPAMPRQLAETLKSVICDKSECDRIDFTISKLVNNDRWRETLLIGLAMEE